MEQRDRRWYVEIRRRIARDYGSEHPLMSEHTLIEAMGAELARRGEMIDRLIRETGDLRRQNALLRRQLNRLEATIEALTVATEHVANHVHVNGAGSDPRSSPL